MKLPKLKNKISCNYKDKNMHTFLPLSTHLNIFFIEYNININFIQDKIIL